MQAHGGQLENGPVVAQAGEPLVVDPHLGIETLLDLGQPVQLAPVAVGNALKVGRHVILPSRILLRPAARRPQGPGVPLCWPT